jgi:hypothetical protein
LSGVFVRFRCAASLMKIDLLFLTVALASILLMFYYNFNDGEQMVVETDLPYTSGSFIVKKIRY